MCAPPYATPSTIKNNDISCESSPQDTIHINCHAQVNKINIFLFLFLISSTCNYMQQMNGSVIVSFNRYRILNFVV